MSKRHDEDKSTLIIDFAALKAELETKQQLVDVPATELQFAGSTQDTGSGLDIETFDDEDSDELSLEATAIKDAVYFFQYKSSIFSDLEEKLTKLVRPIVFNDLAKLNKILMKHEPMVVAFYYNEDPKIVNQLSMQMRSKFPKASSIIIAKNLSKEKAQKHASTKYAADAYLKYPFKIEELAKKVQKLNS